MEKRAVGGDKLFRFQDLAVWQRAADVGIQLDDVADGLEDRKRFRYAEQLRAAALSISNNIAEGSGSKSNNEFRNYLNMAHRSAFECANMLLIFERQKLTAETNVEQLLDELNQICRMLTALSRSLT
jgi:four helix bundle protein